MGVDGAVEIAGVRTILTWDVPFLHEGRVPFSTSFDAPGDYELQFVFTDKDGDSTMITRMVKVVGEVIFEAGFE